MTDPEGRPIVVGQRQPDGPDIPIDFRNIFALLRRLGVTDLRFVPPSNLIGGKGGSFDYTTGIARVADGMSPRETLETAIHEAISHGTDETIDPDFLPKRLNRMSTDDLIAGWPLAQTREATQGVAPDVWADDPPHAALPEELRANSLAGYGVDPEQFKRLYPGVAKAVRDQWNSHPVLSRFLQFNSLAGLGLGLPLSALLGLGTLRGGGGPSADGATRPGRGADRRTRSVGRARRPTLTRNLAMCCGQTGTQTVTQESKSRPWYPQGQYLLGGFSAAADMAQSPEQQSYIGMNPTARQGYEGIVANARDPASATATALKTITDTAAGNFLSTGNPYYQQAYDRAVAPMIDRFNEQVAPGIDAAFSGAGRYGSGLYAQSRNSAETTLARGLADVSAQMGYQTYNDERGRQMQAATIAPQYQDMNNQALIAAGNAFQADAQASQMHGWDNLGRYMSVVGGQPWGGSTSSTSQTPIYSNPMGDLLGLAATIWAKP